MTGGTAVVQALLAEGVDTLFGLPGIQNDWLYNALFDAGDRIRVIHTRHEQGAAYMALGYALATGGIGVYNVVPGPGFLNTTAALSTAYALNAQVLCLAGQIPLAAIGRDGGVLHEIPDQLGVMRSLTKWAARVTRVEEAPGLVAEAFGALRSGRPRPVGLEVPMDVLAAEAQVDGAYAPTPMRSLPVDEAQIDAAVRLLAEARRPLIWVGSGAHGASDAIRRLAEYLQAPVAAYRTGRGVADSRHYLSLVQPQAHALWAETDVVLAIGTHMRVPLQTWGVDDALRVIRVDVDADSHARVRPTTIALTARAEDAVPRLLQELASRIPPRPSRQAAMNELARQWAEQRAFLQPQIAFLDVIREALGEHGIFVDEPTQVGFSARVVMPVYHPRTFISTGYQGTLGYGFQTALGVKVARPDVPVISVSGDGGFLFGVQELATAVLHGINVIADRVQQQPVRQCAADAADALRGARDRVGPAQPGFSAARRGVRRGRISGDHPTRAGRCPSPGARRWPARADRGAVRRHAGRRSFPQAAARARSEGLTWIRDTRRSGEGPSRCWASGQTTSTRGTCYRFASVLCALHPDADPEVVLPAILLHDIGWSTVPKDKILQAFGPHMRYPELRRQHEVEGARLARGILATTGHAAERIDAITTIIDGHDTRNEALSLEDGLVKDADKLWRYTRHGLDTVRGWFGYDTDAQLTLLDEWCQTRFFVDAARHMALGLVTALRAGRELGHG